MHCDVRLGHQSAINQLKKSWRVSAGGVGGAIRVPAASAKEAVYISEQEADGPANGFAVRLVGLHGREFKHALRLVPQKEVLTSCPK